ncbi:6-phosphogluconate dehydrogenase [Stachybotrys elegans]|uniref:6-phosphogluconate dehydrogenase, decarboxylating n=1 Tax=Stachybotrys elegans TaxID=80388 RepID=A0A8K0WP71_9HYPO|nr:6-phosphogluconate dehydrogenase [Stachybotrys elegans]
MKSKYPQRVGMIGTGSMGSGMSLLLAENGIAVHFYDPNEQNVQKLSHDAKAINLENKVVLEDNYEALCRAVKDGSDYGVFFFSTPHGSPIDKSIEAMRPHLSDGDVLIDCANENYASAERRQADLQPDGVYYIGCGVSGGYQAARAGPSFSPGGDPKGLDKILPLLEKISAKDKEGKPCVRPVGPGGSGHYVKTIHNGIEQGMLSVLAEAWSVLTHGVGLSYEELSAIFRQWNSDGLLRGCYLIKIGADILSTKNEEGEYVLDKVRDKVVQDVDETELTGNWSAEEAMAMHVPAATIVCAHMFRYASAFAAQRSGVKAAVSGGVTATSIKVESRDAFIESVRSAVSFCFISCFAEGLDLIREKDKSKSWNLNYRDILQIWSGGCIIQADGIVSLLDQMYANPKHDPEVVLENAVVAQELRNHASAVKEVVLKSVEADLCVPAISQSWEHFKYTTSTTLPTQFMEAQLDYFGKHMFDTWKDPPGLPQKGQSHYEWKPAKGKSDK